MPTLHNWEEYLDLEEELNIEDTRKKVLQKQKNHSKKKSEGSKKGYEKSFKRDKKNSWSNHPNRI